MHSDFQMRSEYAAANFFELFAFVSEFQRRHLSSDLSRIIPPSEFDELVQIREALRELVARAKARLSEEGVDAGEVWGCPNCGEDTFVIADEIDTCYTCSHAEPVVTCPQCSEVCLESELESFVGDLDTDYDEGQLFIHNSYGYTEYEACCACLPEVLAKIEEERRLEEFDNLAREYYSRRRRQS